MSKVVAAKPVQAGGSSHRLRFHVGSPQMHNCQVDYGGWPYRSWES